MATLLRAENIAYQKPGRLILDDVSLHLDDQEIVTIIGPNGAGKTTLIRILLGLIEASSGTVWRKKKLRVGYMPQRLQLNKAMPLPVKSFLASATKNRDLLTRILADLHIESLYHHSMHRLSGGERQRVLLARAILTQPDVLILDEPAQGVDIAGQNHLYELIDSIRHRHHCAVLMVSHDLHLVMAKTDRVICLNQHICCEGHPEQVSNSQAYLSLFGHQPALAPYTHHHDHHHTFHGDVQALS